MIQIDLAVEAGDWPEESVLESLSSRVITATADRVQDQIPARAEVSVVLTDNAQVQALNLQWRGLNKPTNVLSFAANEGGGPITPLLGDIILANETVRQEADEQNISFEHHLAHLLVHGFLHLLEYDHIEDDEADVMEGLETEILASIGIADPYIAESSDLS